MEKVIPKPVSGGDFEKYDTLPVDENTVAAYAGVPGAFAEEATAVFFGEDVKRLPVKSFGEIVQALKEGRAQYGVMPIENSSAGNVETNYDLLGTEDVTIVGEQVIPVEQSVMAVEGADLSTIRQVYSHPQGLMQCSRFLEEQGWEQISTSNTALSAKKVKESGDISRAAIASPRAARLYGLNILKRNANNDKSNCTRFLILSSRHFYVKGADKISLAFGVPHESGTLYKVLGAFERNRINMTMIESRPLPEKVWEYYFFVDIIGDLSETRVLKALREVRLVSTGLRILGNYKSETRDHPV